MLETTIWDPLNSGCPFRQDGGALIGLSSCSLVASKNEATLDEVFEISCDSRGWGFFLRLKLCGFVDFGHVRIYLLLKKCIEKKIWAELFLSSHLKVSGVVVRGLASGQDLEGRVKSKVPHSRFFCRTAQVFCRIVGCVNLCCELLIKIRTCRRGFIWAASVYLLVSMLIVSLLAKLGWNDFAHRFC